MVAKDHQDSSEPGAVRSERISFVKYLLFGLLGLVCGLGFTFALGGSRWFLEHADNPGLRLVGYSQWMGQQNCAVVLYGDSSALTGLDPAVIEARTGLKTCNVAEGTVVQQVTGSDIPLRAYLRQNPAPRYVLGMWTPSMFQPNQPMFQRYRHEGLVYLFAYQGFSRALPAFGMHPEWILRFCSDTYNSLFDAFAGRLLGHHQVPVRAQRVSRSGQWMFPLPPETGCIRTAIHYSPSLFRRHAESVAEFRRKYNNAETKVIVNVAPVPDCDELFDVYARIDAGLYDNAFERLPIRDFNQGDVHFSPEGSGYLSEKAAEQILRAEAGGAKRLRPALTPSDSPR